VLELKSVVAHEIKSSKSTLKQFTVFKMLFSFFHAFNHHFSVALTGRKKIIRSKRRERNYPGFCKTVFEMLNRVKYEQGVHLLSSTSV